MDSAPSRNDASDLLGLFSLRTSCVSLSIAFQCKTESGAFHHVTPHA